MDNMVANEVDDMVAKIRNKDFTDVTLIKVVILMEMMLEVVMGAVYMEVDKVTDNVADMVVDMEVDREAEEEVADMVMDNVHWTWTGTDQDMCHLAHQKIGQFRNCVMSLQNPYFGQTYKKHL